MIEILNYYIGSGKDNWSMKYNRILKENNEAMREK